MSISEVEKVPEVDVARRELQPVEPLLETAEHALYELLVALEPLKKWRASYLYEAVEVAQVVLVRGKSTALFYPSKPEGFKHWRKKSRRERRI